MRLSKPFLDLPNGVSGGSTFWDEDTPAARIVEQEYFGTLTQGRLKVWTGSGWVLKPVKVWSGALWVEKPLKVWNGSNWI